MKIFLSWSGEDSLAAAKIFRQYLPYVVNDFEPWLSHEDIESGGDWNQTIREQLQETDFGILFVTPTNATKPWLLFEAGALAKAVSNSRVCPYLLHGMEPEDIPGGPLTKFHSRRWNYEGTLKLFQDFNAGLENARSSGHVKAVFDKFWGDIESKLAGIPKSTDKPAEVPEEVTNTEMLQILRRLDRKLADVEAEQRRLHMAQNDESRKRIHPSRLQFGEGPVIGGVKVEYPFISGGTEIGGISLEGKAFPESGTDNH